MIKTLSEIEVNIENKICRFIVDHDTPLSHVKEALFQIQKYIGQIEDALRLEQEKALDESKENKVEEFPKEKYAD